METSTRPSSVRRVGPYGVRFSGFYYQVPFQPGSLVRVESRGNLLCFTPLEKEPLQYVLHECVLPTVSCGAVRGNEVLEYPARKKVGNFHALRTPRHSGNGKNSRNRLF